MRQEEKIIILADSVVAIVAVKKAGRTARARSGHLRETVNRITEIEKEGGVVKLGWVKANKGILGNEAADVLAKRAADRALVDDWGGIKQWAKRRKQENVAEGGGIRRAME